MEENKNKNKHQLSALQKVQNKAQVEANIGGLLGAIVFLAAGFLGLIVLVGILTLVVSMIIRFVFY